MPKRNIFVRYEIFIYYICSGHIFFALKMKRFDIAAIGELNVDIIMNGIESEPEIGKEKFAREMTVTLGSSTAIFAANASALGSKVCFVGMIGRDAFGKLVRTSLQARGVDTSYLVEGDTPTGATVCMSYGEDRANLTYQGAMDVMTFDDIPAEIFEEVRHIHLSSLFMQSGLLRDIHRILDAAEEHGVSVSLDTQWDPEEKWALDYKTVLPKIDVFMPNEKELQCLTGAPDLESAIAAVQPYLGGCMMLKCGSDGSVLIRKDGSRKVLPAFLNTEVVDAIGAGDSCNAGFVTAFVKGLPLEECQRIGNLAGAVNTTAAGGTGAFSSIQAVRELCLGRFGQKLTI